MIYVSGGNSANMLAVWSVHGVDRILREAWEAGIVLCGPSAGGLCWFEDAGRRPTLHRLLGEGLPAGIAADDFVGVRFAGRELAEVVSERPGAGAYRVELADGEVRETPLGPVQIVA